MHLGNQQVLVCIEDSAGRLKLMVVQSRQFMGLILQEAEDPLLPLTSGGIEGIERLGGSGLVCAVFWSLILSSGWTSSGSTRRN